MSTYLSFFVLGPQAPRPFDEVTFANHISEKSEGRFKSLSLDLTRHVAHLGYGKLRTKVLEIYGYPVDGPGTIFMIRTVDLYPAADVHLTQALDKMKEESLIEQKYLH